MQVESLEQKTQLLEDGVAAAREALDAADAAFRASSAKIDAMRQTLQEARSQSVACDRRAAEIRDGMAKLDAAAHDAILKRERLSSEEAGLKRSAETAAAALAEVDARLAAARAAEEDASARAEAASTALETLRAEIADARENLGEMQTAAATKEAQLEMLKDECTVEQAPKTLGRIHGCLIGPPRTKKGGGKPQISVGDEKPSEDDSPAGGGIRISIG